MNKRMTPNKDPLTIPCPACGVDIQIAEAVAHAVAERTAKLEQDATSDRARLDKQLKKFKEEHERRLQERTAELAEEHARALSAARAKAERAHQGLLKCLQDEAQQKDTQVAQAQELTWKANKEQQALRQELATLQSSLSNAIVEKQASFEMGRKTGLTQLQKHLDELQAQMLQRERDFSVRLANGIHDAEQRAISDEQRRQKAQFEATLRQERERILAKVTQDQALVVQRHENQMQRLRKEIEVLHQKADDAPSEATGTAAEDLLERRLKETFRGEGDVLARTKKGQRGADFLLTIPRAGSRKILLECKWTQAFDQGWIAKAQQDRATAGAEIVIIVSRTLPAGSEHLSMVQDVWVASVSTVLALVMALRQGLVAMERAGRASSLDEAQVQQLKKYLSGPQFRQQVELIVRLAADQSEGLIKERTQHERSWTQTQEAQEKILATAVAIWTALELHSGCGLQPSEIMKPYLSPMADEEHAKAKRRRNAA